MRILKQIYFESIYSREDTMEKADCGTFEWLLEEGLPDKGLDSEEENDESSEDGGSEDEESERGKSQVEETEKDKESRKRRSQARFTFLAWLHTGNHVFHISGKAGSGKSTLMKLLLDHPRTREGLNFWAGEKHLVFSHFFFWRSGDKLQRSLEGLYRSILFNTLKQCPDLVQEVFPEAYSTFSKVRPENSIDELFFRPEDFGKAFQRLISKSPNPGYRFCFFVDGLDEYGEDDADRLDHEALAESLELWANKEDIKILVSSRPHREFQSIFSEELRIKLHDLTKPDISRFGRNMFKKDKNFSRVEHCYSNLVDKVVEYSDGVFLWARLAIRALLMAVGRREAIDSLEKQLDNIPKDINDFYEKLLDSINPTDRVKTFKMLLLADNPRLKLFPIALTWIDNLDDPKFPISYNIEPYTEDEIQERELAAELQLDYYTKGLLEITTSGYGSSKFYDKNLFFDKRVQFFHRTLRDFVSQSKQLRAFSAEFPDFMSMEMQAQILLATLWFAKTQYITHGSFNFYIFNVLECLPYGASRDIWFDAYQRVLNYHHQAGNTSLQGLHTSPGVEWNSFRSWEDGTQQSFPHWVTWCLGDLDYVLGKQSKNQHMSHSGNDLSFLLSATLSQKDTTALKRLLDLGMSPNEQIKIRRYKPISEETYLITTVWKVFCVFFAVRMILNRSEEAMSLYCRRLAEFLATGVVDANCFILLGRCKESDFVPLPHYDGESISPTHFIRLADLVQQLDPPNWKTLSSLMKYPRCGVFATLWKYLIPSESDQSFRPETCVPYELSMRPPTPDELKDKDSSNKYGFFVHSIRWRDQSLMVQGLHVRLY